MPETITQRFTKSDSCTCAACQSYCYKIPGLWTVEQCRVALDAGLGAQMMLRLPQGRHGILSPAIQGCEGRIADITKLGKPCAFLDSGRCSLHTTPNKPHECRVAHHAERKRSERCHMAIVDQWDSPEGKALVIEWSKAYLAPEELWYVREQLGGF